MSTMENELLKNHLDPSFKKRKSRIKPKDRITTKVSKQIYPFIYAYAIKNELYIEESTDELLRIAIQKVYLAEGIPKRNSIFPKLYKLLKRQYKSGVIELPREKPKLEISEARNRILNKKPDFKIPT